MLPDLISIIGCYKCQLLRLHFVPRPPLPSSSSFLHYLLLAFSSSPFPLVSLRLTFCTPSRDPQSFPLVCHFPRPSSSCFPSPLLVICVPRFPILSFPPYSFSPLSLHFAPLFLLVFCSQLVLLSPCTPFGIYTVSPLGNHTHDHLIVPSLSASSRILARRSIAPVAFIKNLTLPPGVSRKSRRACSRHRYEWNRQRPTGRRESNFPERRPNYRSDCLFSSFCVPTSIVQCLFIRQLLFMV